MIKSLDCRRETIRSTDLSFEAVAETGLSKDPLMAETRGLLPSRESAQDLGVLSALYSTFGELLPFANTTWTGHKSGLDKLYTAFAKNRLRLTGRCSDDRSVVGSK